MAILRSIALDRGVRYLVKVSRSHAGLRSSGCVVWLGCLAGFCGSPALSVHGRKPQWTGINEVPCYSEAAAAAEQQAASIEPGCHRLKQTSRQRMGRCCSYVHGYGFAQTDKPDHTRRHRVTDDVKK